MQAEESGDYARVIKATQDVAAAQRRFMFSCGPKSTGRNLDEGCKEFLSAVDHARCGVPIVQRPRLAIENGAARAIVESKNKNKHTTVRGVVAPRDNNEHLSRSRSFVVVGANSSASSSHNLSSSALTCMVTKSSSSSSNNLCSSASTCIVTNSSSSSSHNLSLSAPHLYSHLSV